MLTDKVVDSGFYSHLQLSTNTVSTADKHWVPVAGCLQVEDTTEATNLCICAGAAGATDERLDGIDKRVACVNGDTCLRVGKLWCFGAGLQSAEV